MVSDFITQTWEALILRSSDRLKEFIWDYFLFRDGLRSLYGWSFVAWAVVLCLDPHRFEDIHEVYTGHIRHEYVSWAFLFFFPPRSPPGRWRREAGCLAVAPKGALSLRPCHKPDTCGGPGEEDAWHMNGNKVRCSSTCSSSSAPCRGGSPPCSPGGALCPDPCGR